MSSLINHLLVQRFQKSINWLYHNLWIYWVHLYQLLLGLDPFLLRKNFLWFNIFYSPPQYKEWSLVYFCWDVSNCSWTWIYIDYGIIWLNRYSQFFNHLDDPGIGIQLEEFFDENTLENNTKSKCWLFSNDSVLWKNVYWYDQTMSKSARNILPHRYICHR